MSGIIPTDHERAFADSPAGAAAIAHERHKHDLREAHRGAIAAPWTDAHTAAAVRTLAKGSARARVVTAAAAAQVPDLRAAEQAALAARNEATRNAWKGVR